MARTLERKKARAVWFGIVDVMILLILIAFGASLFLIDGYDDGVDEGSTERLVFAVSVQSPYHKDLFLQEGDGAAVALRARGASENFGVLLLGDNGVFYVECDLSAVDPSEDREGLWVLGETVLMRGALLEVESELADFSLTVLSSPERAQTGSVGTTEPLPETTAEPETLPPVTSGSDTDKTTEEGSPDASAPADGEEITDEAESAVGEPSESGEDA